jgi:hypothetical protein
MAYTIDWRGDGVLVTMTGKVDIKELNEANGRLHGDERFDAMRYQVWDLLGASLAPITLREIEQPTAIDRVAAGINAKVRVALVTVTPHDIALCEHYATRSESLGSTWEIRVFPERVAAWAWIRG